VALIGAVGDDSAGVALREVVLAEGIDDRWLDTIAGVATGRALIQVDKNAENSIVVIAGANSHVHWPGDAPTSTIALAQLEIPRATVVQAFESLRARGGTTILNPAPAAELSTELLAATSIVVPNEHELELLGGRDQMSANGIGTLLVTRGAAGVDVHTQSDSRHVDAYDVTPVDTTGAGDSFCGNLAARLAAGDPLETAVDWAAAAGALATTTAGAVPSLPLASATRALVETP
jgi:ribokinase